MNNLKTYQLLLQDCDHVFLECKEQYQDSITCHSGCCQCCTCGSVFAIEAYFIAHYWLKHKAGENQIDPPSEMCPFLNQNRCLIYQVRPLICRTHGMALAIVKENFLDWNTCPLNFKQGLPETFQIEDFLYIEPINEDLAMLNILFLQQNKLNSARARIQMRDLYSDPEDFLRLLNNCPKLK